MKLSSGIQELLVAMLCFDSAKGGGRLVRGLIPTKSFDPYYRDVAEAAVAYIDKYSQVPGEHTLDLVAAIKERMPDEASVFDRVYQSLESCKHNINREYVLAQATAFRRYQQIRGGIGEALEALKRDDEGSVEEAAAALANATKTQYELFDAGTQFDDTERLLRFLGKEHDAFPCGVPELDHVGLGPARKKLHVFAALSGHGKSWWLLHLAKVAWRHNLRVCYISLELSEEECSQRFVQSVLALTKRRERELTRQRFEKDELGRVVRFDPLDIAERLALNDDGVKTKLTRKLERYKRRPALFIKEFPPNTIKVPQVEAYLDSLEASHGFVPDLVLVDYADRFITDPKNYRHDLRNHYESLRAVAMKRNIAVATATQLNRTGYGTKVLKAKHVAEGIGKVETADVFITFNRTDAEKRLNVARLHVDKARSDVDKFTVLIAQNYTMGQFVLDSARMSPSYWNLIPDDDDEDGKDHHGEAPDDHE
jgi:KaiC/GvpD/RAD55 family RecA-like ATPase